MPLMLRNALHFYRHPYHTRTVTCHASAECGVNVSAGDLVLNVASAPDPLPHGSLSSTWYPRPLQPFEEP